MDFLSVALSRSRGGGSGLPDPSTLPSGTLMVNMTPVEREDEPGLFDIRTDARVADIITELRSGKNVFAVLDFSGEEPWFEFLPLIFARTLGNEQRVEFGINEGLEDNVSITYRVQGVYSGGVDIWEYIQV